MAGFTDNVELTRNGFIYEATEPTSDAMADLAPNRSLLIADLTDKPATKPELIYELETVEAVFEKFQPKCKVEFKNEEGASVNETLAFTNPGDFGRDALVKQSDFLGTLQSKQKDFEDFEKTLRTNKVLQNKILKDPEKKQAYLTILRYLIQELEEK